MPRGPLERASQEFGGVDSGRELHRWLRVIHPAESRRCRQVIMRQRIYRGSGLPLRPIAGLPRRPERFAGPKFHILQDALSWVCCFSCIGCDHSVRPHLLLADLRLVFQRAVAQFGTDNRKRRPDLSIIAPGRWVARMPGTGTPRRTTHRPGKRRLWVSRELRPPDSSAYRLSFWLHRS